MEVMVWFYEHYEQFSPLLQNEEKKTEHDSDSEEEEEKEAEKIVEHSLAQRVQFVDEMSMLEENYPILLDEDGIDVIQSSQDQVRFNQLESYN